MSGMTNLPYCNCDGAFGTVRSERDSLAARVKELEARLEAIQKFARKGKAEVESVTIDRPVFVAPNIAAHWFDAIRKTAAGGGRRVARAKSPFAAGGETG